MQKPVANRFPKRLFTGLSVLLILASLPAEAGTEMAATKEITPPSVCSENDWTIELGSGVGFSNVRNTQDRSYTIVPMDVTAALKLDDVGLDNYLGGWLRGYTEFTFRGDYSYIASGPEHSLACLYVGPRYNFVQPNWKIVPFIEGGVGIIFANSNATPYQLPSVQGLGQDFNFSFQVAAGARYDFSKDWFMRLAVEYRHVSNAGLSEPKYQNNAIDALGPRLSIGYSF